MPTTPNSDASIAVALDAEGRLIDEIPCRKCGYNLRGLLAAGVCTECGTPVGRSTEGDLLRFCDPVWIATLARGANWLVAAIAIGFLLGCTVVASFAIVPSVSGFAIYVTLVPGVLSLIAYWLLTSPDPGRMDPESNWSMRRLVRIGAVAGLVMNPLQVFVLVAGSVLAQTVAVLAWIVGIVMIIAICSFAREIAMRIPNDRLARHARIVMWGFLSISAAHVIGRVIVAVLSSTTAPMFAGTTAWPPTAATGPAAAISPSSDAPTDTTASTSNPSGAPKPTTQPVVTGVAVGRAAAAPFAAAGPTNPIFIAGGCVVGAASLFFGVWSLWLIDRFRKALRTAAEQAKARWEMGTA